jgi:hypothetical protein
MSNQKQLQDELPAILENWLLALCKRFDIAGRAGASVLDIASGCGEIYRHASWFEASVPSENHRKFFSAIGSLNVPTEWQSAHSPPRRDRWRRTLILTQHPAIMGK